jgi:hypothetical protein
LPPPCSSWSRGQVQSFRLPRPSKSAAYQHQHAAVPPAPACCFPSLVSLWSRRSTAGVQVDGTTRSAMCRRTPVQRTPKPATVDALLGRWQRCWCLRWLLAAAESRLAAASPDLGHRPAGAPADLCRVSCCEFVPVPVCKGAETFTNLLYNLLYTPSGLVNNSFRTAARSPEYAITFGFSFFRLLL